MRRTSVAVGLVLAALAVQAAATPSGAGAAPMPCGSIDHGVPWTEPSRLGWPGVHPTRGPVHAVDRNASGWTIGTTHHVVDAKMVAVDSYVAIPRADGSYDTTELPSLTHHEDDTDPDPDGMVYAVAVTDANEVWGNIQTPEGIQAFRWAPERGYRLVGNVPGAVYFWLHDVNDHDQMAGVFQFRFERSRAWINNGHSYRDIGIGGLGTPTYPAADHWAGNRLRIGESGEVDVRSGPSSAQRWSPDDKPCAMPGGSSLWGEKPLVTFHSVTVGRTDEARVPVTLDHPVPWKVYIRFHTQPITAFDGFDYWGADGGVAIWPGQTRVEIPVRLLRARSWAHLEELAVVGYRVDGAIGWNSAAYVTLAATPTR